MARIIDKGLPQHAPTEKQQRLLAALVDSDAIYARRMRHKKTGEWHTIMMLVRPTDYPGGPVYTAGMARVFEDAEIDKYLDDYEPPDGTEIVANPDRN